MLIRDPRKVGPQVQILYPPPNISDTIKQDMNFIDVTNYLGITNTKAQEPVTPLKPTFNLEHEGEKKVLVEWESVAKIHRPGFNEKSMRTIVVIAIVIGLLLIIMQEYALILAIGSIVFIGYALSKAPVESVKYEITNHGVKYAAQFYYWNELTQFYFVTSRGENLMAVDTKERLPGRLFLSINPTLKDKIKSVFETYLPYLEKEPETFMDRTYKSVVAKINVDKK